MFFVFDDDRALGSGTDLLRGVLARQARLRERMVDLAGRDAVFATWSWNWEPPANSMPMLNPRVKKLIRQISTMTPEAAYHRRRVRMKPNRVSPR